MAAELSRRCVEAEILDGLAADDPAATASRRDLRRINRLMFHPPIMAALLKRHVRAPPRRIAEIGAGDGSLMLAVGRRLSVAWPDVSLTLVDRTGLKTEERTAAFSAIGWAVEWVTADVFDWLETRRGAPFDIIAANLFLHHFEGDALRTLLDGVSRQCLLFAAVEPRRSPGALAASRLLFAIGAGSVTRHDAPASVRAGFTGDEIGASWPAKRGAVLDERSHLPFSHVFAASGSPEGRGA